MSGLDLSRLPRLLESKLGNRNTSAATSNILYLLVVYTLSDLRAALVKATTLAKQRTIISPPFFPNPGSLCSNFTISSWCLHFPNPLAVILTILSAMHEKSLGILRVWGRKRYPSSFPLCPTTCHNVTYAKVQKGSPIQAVCSTFLLALFLCWADSIF